MVFSEGVVHHVMIVVLDRPVFPLDFCHLFCSQWHIRDEPDQLICRFLIITSACINVFFGLSPAPFSQEIPKRRRGIPAIVILGMKYADLMAYPICVQPRPFDPRLFEDTLVLAAFDFAVFVTTAIAFYTCVPVVASAFLSGFLINAIKLE